MHLCVLVAGIKNTDDLRNFIRQESLVNTDASLEGVSNLSNVSGIYFGIGLVNGSRKLSNGLPIDVLSMILASEQIDAPKHILIADTAAVNDGFDALTIELMANQYKQALWRSIHNFGFGNWSIWLNSELSATDSYKTMLAAAQGRNDYTRREIADMQWFCQEQNVNLKVGWALEGSKQSDEISFDRQFVAQHSDQLGFMYVIPGRTFDPVRVRSPPYFCHEKEERILLEDIDAVSTKFDAAKSRVDQKVVQTYQNYLNSLVRLFDKTVERTPWGPIEDRLQHILLRANKHTI